MNFSKYFRGQKSADKTGLGVNAPHNLEQDDDEFDAYRKRMMLAYRFRPNPLVSFNLLSERFRKLKHFYLFTIQNNPRRAYY